MNNDTLTPLQLTVKQHFVILQITLFSLLTFHIMPKRPAMTQTELQTRLQTHTGPMTNADIIHAMRTMLFPQYLRSDGKFEFYNLFEHGTCKRKVMILTEEQMLYAGTRFGPLFTGAAAVVSFWAENTPALLVDENRTTEQIAQQFPRSNTACCICTCFLAARNAVAASISLSS